LIRRVLPLTELGVQLLRSSGRCAAYAFATLGRDSGLGRSQGELHKCVEVYLVEQLCCTLVRASASVGAGLPANELAKALRAQSLPQT
jgi:hypothetical protein